MAWTSGVTRTTSDLVTAANWNSYLGAGGSLDYLKDETDKLYVASYSNPTRVHETQYQNGSKIRICCVTFIMAEGRGGAIRIGSASASNTVARCYNGGSNLDDIIVPITAVIPPNWYYGSYDYLDSPTMSEWIEWDLH